MLSSQRRRQDDEKRKLTYNAIKGIIFHCCCNRLGVSDIGCDCRRKNETPEASGTLKTVAWESNRLLVNS